MSPPSSGSRALDRDKVLERYKRPSVPSADRTRPEPPAPSRQGADRERGRTADEVTGARDLQRQREAESRARERTDGRAEPRERTRDERANVRPGPISRTGRDALAGTRARAVADGRRDVNARATEVKDRRDLWRAEQQVKRDLRTQGIAERRTRRLREIAATNPREAQILWSNAKTYSKCNGWGFNVGLSIGYGWCSPWGGYWASCWPSSWYWSSWDHCGTWGYWWAYGGYPYSWCTHPFGWSYYWYWGRWPYRMSSWWPYYYDRYYYSPVVYYSSYLADPDYDDDPDVVIYDYDDDDDVVVYDEGGGDVRVIEREADVGESVQYGETQRSGAATSDTVAGVLERGPDSRARAATAYLADGDRAFRERRYGDAAHFYAKAIEFRPDDGVLYLVLADALFATGDYHYGAYALRRALELDPDLARSDIDKYAFYVDPTELDRQLQVLERFLAEHPTDGDARLLLAANYLFARKPRLTIDLLESGASEPVRNEPAGKLLLEAAKELESRGL